MDGLAALWLTSIVGAAGFTATGFFLARSRMAGVSSLPIPAEEPSAEPDPKPAQRTERAEPEPGEAAAATANVATKTHATPAPPSIERPHDPRREDDDRVTIDPPAPTAPSTDSVELEHQLEALRVELRSEVVARHTVEARAQDLEARLSSMSQQVAALRARTSADTGGSRRPPAQRGASLVPGPNVEQRSRLSTRAPGLFAEIDELKAEIARLTSENDSLRASALGAPTPTPRASGPRSDLIVPDVLKRMVERIARLDNVRAAAVVENNGLVLASSGERSEALAAFGNYLRDAATRSNRLLPLGMAEEVIVRDVHGAVFSSRVLGRPEAELALVTLASKAIPVTDLREIVGQTPGLNANAISAK